MIYILLTGLAFSMVTALQITGLWNCVGIHPNTSVIQLNVAIGDCKCWIVVIAVNICLN